MIWERIFEADIGALTILEMEGIVQRFDETAYLCWKADYDGVQVCCVSF